MLRGDRILRCSIRGECFLSVHHPRLRSVRQGEGSGLRTRPLGDSPPPRPHCTLEPGNAPSTALWNFPEWGAQRPGAQVEILWGPAVHSLALNHTGRKLIPSLPIFLTGSRRASQLRATIPLTPNTFPVFSLRERSGLGKSNSIRPVLGTCASSQHLVLIASSFGSTQRWLCPGLS